MNNKIELIYTVNYTQSKKDGRKIVRGKSWVNFENVINDPENGINDLSLLGMKCRGMVKPNGDVSFSTSKPEDPNDMNTQNIINAYHFLASTGRYEMPSLETIIEELIYAKEDKISSSDAEKVDADADAMYIEFMKKINEPDTQMLLKSIGQYQMATDTYGWKLSCDNVMRILSQRPDATFLQTRRQWYNRFNRKIKPDSKRIVVVVPSHDLNGLSHSDISEVMREIGYPSSISFEDLSTQQRNHVIIIARYHLGRGFNTMAFYDVSDTYVIDGKEDIWANEAGFDNNLTGHLNARAMNDINTRIANGEGDLKDIYNQEEGNVELLNDALMRGIGNRYPDVRIVSTGDADSDFKENLFNLANYLLETKSKMVRQEHRNTAIRIIMGFIFAFSKLNVGNVIGGLNNQILTDEAYLEVRNRINDIIRLINNAMIRRENVYMESLSESLPYLKSVDQMLDMIGVNPEEVPSENELEINNESIKRESIIENFQNMLNRLNNNSFYNDKFN